MPFPNFPHKHHHDALITPEKFFAQHNKSVLRPKSIPESIIICYNSRFFKQFQELGRLQLIHHDTFLLPRTRRKLAVMKLTGIGAPHAVTRLEEWIALGTKRFLAVGSAGGLQKNLRIGDIVLCTKAIRDEGTSHHYLKPGKYAFPSQKLTRHIRRTLQKLRIPYRAGASWTVDAPYRETVAEMRQYQKEGVLTVEMEASALFVVAQVRKVTLASLMVVSDILVDKDWKADFYGKRLLTSAKKVVSVALETLLKYED